MVGQTDPMDKAPYGLLERPESASSVGKFRLHPDTEEAFCRFQQDAMRVGIALQITSGFRSFERQLSIWNRKMAGELVVWGKEGQALDLSQLSEKARVFAVLRWSALPGASRHHWGTDVDVFDAAVTLPEGYRLQLTQQEVQEFFHRLHDWLDKRIASHTAQEFFRPYDRDRGGISPEPWHLSYAPVAREYQQAFSLQQLIEIVQETDIELKNVILENIQEIHDRYIVVPDSCYPQK